MKNLTATIPEGFIPIYTDHEGPVVGVIRKLKGMGFTVKKRESGYLIPREALDAFTTIRAENGN